jgi:hypothetical protein
MPTAVAFGPDGKLYIGTQGGMLARFTLNDSYDAVVGYTVSNVLATNKHMCILGIAFDPMEPPELADQISVYVSVSQIYHGQHRNSFELAINGRISVIRGANLDRVTDIIRGLPVSEKDHAVSFCSAFDSASGVMCSLSFAMPLLSNHQSVGEWHLFR